jgi:hypothetical protein
MLTLTTLQNYNTKVWWLLCLVDATGVIYGDLFHSGCRMCHTDVYYSCKCKRYVGQSLCSGDTQAPPGRGTY